MWTCGECGVGWYSVMLEVCFIFPIGGHILAYTMAATVVRVRACACVCVCV